MRLAILITTLIAICGYATSASATDAARSDGGRGKTKAGGYDIHGGEFVGRWMFVDSVSDEPEIGIKTKPDSDHCSEVCSMGFTVMCSRKRWRLHFWQEGMRDGPVKVRVYTSQGHQSFSFDINGTAASDGLVDAPLPPKAIENLLARDWDSMSVVALGGGPWNVSGGYSAIITNLIDSPTTQTAAAFVALDSYCTR
jgi:hypothetical protein